METITTITTVTPSDEIVYIDAPEFIEPIIIHSPRYVPVNETN